MSSRRAPELTFGVEVHFSYSNPLTCENGGTRSVLDGFSVVDHQTRITSMPGMAS